MFFLPFQYLGQLRRKKPACARYHPLSSITNTLVNAQTNTATSVTGGEATRRGEERGERGGGLTWKNAQPAVGLPNPCRGGSLVLRVQCVNWQTQECEDYSLAAWRGRHSVDTWCGYSSLSLSLLSSSSKRCSESTGALPSERRERASIHDQSCVKNKLQPVLDTYSYFFSFSFFLPAQIALLYAPPLRC